MLGVCRGIAHSYVLSSSTVRLTVVVLAILIPGCSVVATFLVYLLLGLLLPVSDEC